MQYDPRELPQKVENALPLYREPAVLGNKGKGWRERAREAVAGIASHATMDVPSTDNMATSS
ncbi:hypothetical protein BC936DRAFT_143882 [Jimgerdemannia flammicorona]|uniref:Uncharacterized protein n=1 Tax=Jimgerdemannia flammicorona TaxID=994334 RepID=A0A432ZYF1_9FUNG|nr:hypothetical protein BC936DRAFT_143882 [Jimgerdemannia flammicorona]